MRPATSCQAPGLRGLQESTDLLQAMNTGHDGSMGNRHANNPREALSRMENMIAMGSLNISNCCGARANFFGDSVIIQVQRLRDGSRKVIMD